MKTTERTFGIFYLPDNPWPDVIAKLESYENVDGYIVGIYEGNHYASLPDGDSYRICTEYPVPKDKQIPKGK